MARCGGGERGEHRGVRLYAEAPRSASRSGEDALPEEVISS
jgi:hypothetical protein